MPRVVLTPELFEDFDRIADHLADFNVRGLSERISEILQAIEVLSHSPRIGRAVAHGYRELVIGGRAHGFLALYEYKPAADRVDVVAVRHQRENGYRRNL